MHTGTRINSNEQLIKLKVIKTIGFIGIVWGSFTACTCTDRPMYPGNAIKKNDSNATGSQPVQTVPTKEEALCRAVVAGQIATVKKLLDEGANINQVEANGKTLLHQAIDKKNVVMVNTLIQEAGRRNLALAFDKPDSQGCTPLLAAIKSDNGALLAAFPNASMDINQQVVPGNNDPLLYWTVQNHPDQIPTLIAKVKNFDPNQKFLRGKTLLNLVACDSRGKNALLALLQEGADPNIPDDNGFRPLHGAALLNDPSLIAALLQAGADPNLQNNVLESCLHVAVEQRNKEIVAALLKSNTIQMDITNYHNETPLELAQNLGYDEIVQLIINSGK